MCGICQMRGPKPMPRGFEGPKGPRGPQGPKPGPQGCPKAPKMPPFAAKGPGIFG